MEALEPGKSITDVPEFCGEVAHSTYPKTNSGSPEFILYSAPVLSYWTSLVAQTVKNLSAMQETWV